jgi:hypothetical protein
VAQGIRQVPAQDFTNSHAQDMTDLALCVAHIIFIMTMFCTGQFDIETAVLYSEVDSEIYFRINFKVAMAGR